MKKIFLMATLAIALSGITMAQTSPKPTTKQPAKKEAAAPAKEETANTDKTKDAKKSGNHHHKKHSAKAPKQS